MSIVFNSEFFTFLCLVAAIFIVLLSINVFYKFNKSLFLFIPILLGLSFYGWYIIESNKGFATEDISDLKQEFIYISHFNLDDKIFLLALPQGANQPRLYLFPPEMSNDQMRRNMQEAYNALQEGVVQQGIMRDNTIQLHAFDYTIEMPKQKEAQ